MSAIYPAHAPPVRPREEPGKPGGLVDHGREQLELIAVATAYDARLLRLRVQDWLRSLEATDGLIEDLGLAVYEALANTVEHAYYSGRHRPTMRLQAWLNHDQVVVTVSDQGRWRDPGTPEHRGRGMTVMRYLADDVDIDITARGTTVQLRSALTRADPAATPAEPPHTL